MRIVNTRIQNLRVVGQSSGAAVESDTYFNLVSLLLPGNGTNGAQNNTFLDSSTNNFTVTRNGNTTQGTFSPFSQTGWSNYFDGGANSLTVAANTALDLTGNFTIEFWAWAVDSTTNYMCNGTQSGSGCWRLTMQPSNGSVVWSMAINTWAGVNISSTTGLFSPNQWVHFAVTRSGNDHKVFINGTVVASTTVAGSLVNTGRITQIGYYTDGNGTYFSKCFFSNLRIIKGTALYTANFTPPTAPLTAVSGTSLLTCQSNRFIDNSANAFAITVGGIPSVQAFAPFDPTAAYSTTNVGGSAYFDGSGDYLSTSTTQIIPASTTYSVEAWVYLTGDYSVYREIVTQGSSGNANRWLMFVNITDGTLRIQTGETALSTSFVVPLNTWTHLAFVNNAGSYNIYANGTSVASGSSAMVPQNTYLTVGAFQTGTEYFQGYISNVRISNVARSITVPTSPYTSDGNTRFLMSAANGGITDATAKNVLETVGGAAISTAQSKFGGSSMLFDGTGDYLTFPSSPNFALGSTDFTVEYWINTAASADDGILQISTTPGGFATSYTNGLMMAVVSGVLYYALGGSSVNTSTTINNGNWRHIAMSRSGSSLKIFVDGTQVSSATNSNSVTGTYLVVGGYYSTSFTLNGYINDLRITKGYARYTANFTAPTTAFPTQ